LILGLGKMEIMKTSIKAILNNIVDAEQYLDKDAINSFEDTIIAANNIFVTGAGRSGLAAKAFAMRLMHLGLSAYVVGETISPAINEGDCIVAISGSGETNTIVSAAKIAKSRGSKVLSLTSYPDSTLGQLSDSFILVKGRTKKEVDDENYMKRQIHGNYTSLTPLGTAFELTTLVFLDAIVSELMEKMQQTESDLKARHTVLE
jgi:6-phospho-3-hexuloisomerase